MKAFYRLIILLSLMVLFSSCTNTAAPQPADEESPAADGDKPVVGLVMKSLANEFFKAMEEGALAHVEERGDLELIPLGIKNETDVSTQIEIVENLIAQNVDAIVIAPADSRALVPVLAKANEAGIKLINIDVMIDSETMQEAGIDIPFIGPDNADAAEMVGDVLGEKLGEGAKIVILGGVPGAENARARAEGFNRSVKTYKLDLVAEETAYWETEEAFTVLSNLLTANPDIQGVMTSNDNMALGAVQAIDAAGKTGEILVVGFDNIEPIQPLIEDGTVLATLDQFGAKQAAFGIDFAMRAIDGEKLVGWNKTEVELIVSPAAGGLSEAEPASDNGDGEKPVVGLVMKSLANEFFKTMEEGAQKYAAERGDFELIAVGMNSETDIDTQINAVEGFIAQGVDMIVLAPADSAGLVPSVKKAIEAGITVVNFDVRLDPEALAEAGLEDLLFVGPDNAGGAKLAGDKLAETLGPGGKVIIIEGNPGADNARARLEGFLQSVEEGELELLDSQTAYWETEEAFNLVSNLITANPDVQGIMAANDSMALGAVQAVDAAGRDDILVVGFDNITAAQELMKNGKLLATVDQFGPEMAANAIEVGFRMMDGETITGWEKTPIELVTMDDMQ